MASWLKYLKFTTGTCLVGAGCIFCAAAYYAGDETEMILWYIGAAAAVSVGGYCTYLSSRDPENVAEDAANNELVDNAPDLPEEDAARPQEMDLPPPPLQDGELLGGVLFPDIENDSEDDPWRGG